MQQHLITCTPASLIAVTLHHSLHALNLLTSHQPRCTPSANCTSYCGHSLLRTSNSLSNRLHCINAFNIKTTDLAPDQYRTLSLNDQIHKLARLFHPQPASTLAPASTPASMPIPIPVPITTPSSIDVLKLICEQQLTYIINACSQLSIDKRMSTVRSGVSSATSHSASLFTATTKIKHHLGWVLLIANLFLVNGLDVNATRWYRMDDNSLTAIHWQRPSSRQPYYWIAAVWRRQHPIFDSQALLRNSFFVASPRSANRAVLTHRLLLLLSLYLSRNRMAILVLNCLCSRLMQIVACKQSDLDTQLVLDIIVVSSICIWADHIFHRHPADRTARKKNAALFIARSQLPLQSLVLLVHTKLSSHSG